MKQRVEKISWLTTIMLFLGCNNFLTVYPPPDQLSAHQVFGSRKDVEGAIGGVYNKLTDLGSYSYYNSLVNGLYSDELQLGANADETNREFESSYLSPDNSRIQYLWEKTYGTVYTVNSVLEGIQGKDFLSSEEQRQYRGELLALRAYCYLELVSKFGGVPIITGTSFQDNATIPRAEQADVYRFIESDLQEATSLLNIPEPVRNFKVNLWAAKGLLARLYWILGQWQNALEQADDLINAQVYGPLPELETVFLEYSPETIWSLDFQNNSYLITQEAEYFLPYTTATIPNFMLNEDLLGSFHPDDRRLQAWTGHQVVDGIAYYYPAKYKNKIASQPVDFVSMMRLAEIYLIRAEARTQLGDLNGAAADIDRTRLRAGLPSYPTTVGLLDEETMLNAITQERRLEFFSEIGIRWMDLKRSGQADAVLSRLKPATWQSKGLLWPIPTKELDLNPFLTPNESND